MEHFRMKHESVIPSVIAQQYILATSPICALTSASQIWRVSKILSFNVLNFYNYISLKLRDFKFLKSQRIVDLTL
jgi:hypothetical protein